MLPTWGGCNFLATDPIRMSRHANDIYSSRSVHFRGLLLEFLPVRGSNRRSKNRFFEKCTLTTPPVICQSTYLEACDPAQGDRPGTCASTDRAYLRSTELGPRTRSKNLGPSPGPSAGPSSYHGSVTRSRFFMEKKERY